MTTEIEITASRPRQENSRGTPRALWSRQTGLNDTMGWVIVLILFVVPIPLGSNRPVFWAMSAVLVGLASIYYLGNLSRVGGGFHFGFRRMWLSILLFVLLGVFVALQTFPLHVLGEAAEPLLQQLRIATPGGAVVEAPTISLAPGATMLMLLRLVTYGLLFFLVLQVGTNYQRKEFILNVLLAIISLHAIFGLASLVQFGDTLLGFPKAAYEGSATGTFVNRNSFATFLSFGAVLAVALAAGKLTRAAESNPHRHRLDPVVLVYVVALAINLSALIATQSRMGVFAGTVGALLVLALAVLRSGNVLGRLLVLLPLLALGFGVGVYYYGEGLVDRLGSLDASADVRLELYAQVLGMIQARPLLGYGGGAFEIAYPLFHQQPVSVDLLWDRVHNTYLALWVELGLIFGSIPLLLLVVATIRIVWGMAGARSDWTARVVSLGVIATAAVHSLADFSLEIQAVTMFFVTLVALGLSGTARRDRS